MIRNYLTLALRKMQKNKFFSGLNIFGLSVGLTCCMLIALYIFEETHYDRQHPRAADLYRVGTVFARLQDAADEPEMRTYHTASPLAEALRQDFPEIEKTVRVHSVFDREKTLIRSLDNGQIVKAFNEPKGYFADSTYFELFRYEFIEGNPAKALSEPGTVVISEDIARKFFGNQPAYGKALRISNSWFETGELDFRVSGVFRQPTAPSQFDGRFFMSIYSGGLGDYLEKTTDLATNNMFDTYLLLRPGADPKALEAKMPAFVDKRMGSVLKALGFNKKQFLTRLSDVHLSGVEKSGGSITYLYILGSIALFTLLIACVNFMNLSTARSAKRASEVGVRKSVGATKSNLIGQFLGESMLISMASFLLAMGLAWLALPFFKNHRPCSAAFWGWPC